MSDFDPQPSVDAGQAQQLTINARRFKLYLAQNVTVARRRAGLTQLQLAQAAELSRATVHLVEAGICDPRLSTITRLADALGVDAWDLLTKDIFDGIPDANEPNRA
jgi:transcriptional regulator with XRE-family HTH domain